MYQITSRKASHFFSDLKPLFPDYMFVSVNFNLALWRTINSTIGVSKLVSFKGQPKPLPLQLITRLMLRCNASSTILPHKNLKQGNGVELLNGPFTSFIATIDTIDPKQHIWVLTDFMRQKTRIQFSEDQMQLSK